MVAWKVQLVREACVELGLDPRINYLTDENEIAIFFRTIFDSTVKNVLSEGKYDAIMVSIPLSFKNPTDKHSGYHIPADFLRPVGVINSCDCQCDSCYHGISYTTNVQFTIMNEALFINFNCCTNYYENSFACACCDACPADLVYTSFRVDDIPINLYTAIKKSLINQMVFNTTKDLNTKTVAKREYDEEIKKANVHQGDDFKEANSCCFIPYLGSGTWRLR